MNITNLRALPHSFPLHDSGWIIRGSVSAPHSCVSSIWLILLSIRASQQQQAADRGQITPLSATQTKGPKQPLSVLLDIRQLQRLATCCISAPSPLTVWTNSLLTSFLITLLNLEHEDTEPHPVTQKTGSLYEHVPPSSVSARTGTRVREQSSEAPWPLQEKQRCPYLAQALPTIHLHICGWVQRKSDIFYSQL